MCLQLNILFLSFIIVSIFHLYSWQSLLYFCFLIGNNKFFWFIKNSCTFVLPKEITDRVCRTKQLSDRPVPSKSVKMAVMDLGETSFTCIQTLKQNKNRFFISFYWFFLSCSFEPIVLWCCPKCNQCLCLKMTQTGCVKNVNTGHKHCVTCKYTGHKHTVSTDLAPDTTNHTSNAGNAGCEW